MNQIFQSEWWEVTLPSGWTGSEEEECADFSSESDDGVGSLQISAYRNAEALAVSDVDLEEMIAEDVLETGAQLEPVELGDFTGFHFSYQADGEYWRTWILRCSRTMLYATYTCEPADQGQEDPPVQQILASLKLRA